MARGLQTQRAVAVSQSEVPRAQRRVRSPFRPAAPPLPPSARSLPEPDAREPAAPFAELLDSAAPGRAASTPAGATERTERNDPPKADARHRRQAGPGQRAGNAEAKDSEATPGKKASTPKASRTTTAASRRPTRQRTTTARPRTATRRFSRCPGENRHGPVDRAAAGRDCSPATVVAVAQPLRRHRRHHRERHSRKRAARGDAGCRRRCAQCGAETDQAQGDKAADASAKTGAPADPQAGVPDQ